MKSLFLALTVVLAAMFVCAESELSSGKAEASGFRTRVVVNNGGFFFGKNRSVVRVNNRRTVVRSRGFGGASVAVNAPGVAVAVNRGFGNAVFVNRGFGGVVAVNSGFRHPVAINAFRINAFGTRTVTDAFGNVFEVDAFGNSAFRGSAFRGFQVVSQPVFVGAGVPTSGVFFRSGGCFR